MKKFWNIYDKIEKNVMVAALFLSVISTFVGVVLRYVFNYSLSWTEELNRYIFIWLIWLGTSTGFKEHEHIDVGLVVNKMNPKGQKVLYIFRDLVLIAFCLFLTISGARLVGKLFQLHSISPALQLPMAYVYLALPVSNFFCSLRLIYDMVNKVKNKPDEIKEINVNEGGES